MAAEPQSMAEASPRTQQALAKALNTLVSKHKFVKHKFVANKFAFNVNAGTPVVLVNVHCSEKSGDGS